MVLTECEKPRLYTYKPEYVCGHIQASFQSKHVSEVPVKHSCFLAVLAALIKGWQCWLIEISQQLLDGFPYILYKRSWSPEDDDFGDLLTFPLVSPAGQCFHHHHLLCDHRNHRNHSEGNGFTSSLVCSGLSDFSVWSEPKLQMWNHSPDQTTDKKIWSGSNLTIVWFVSRVKTFFWTVQTSGRLSAEPEKGKTMQQNKMSCGSIWGEELMFRWWETVLYQRQLQSLIIRSGTIINGYVYFQFNSIQRALLAWKVLKQCCQSIKITYNNTIILVSKTCYINCVLLLTISSILSYKSFTLAAWWDYTTRIVDSSSPDLKVTTRSF